MTVKKPTTADEMLNYLARSRDVRSVAKKLLNFGIKGKPGKSCDCPIANALKYVGCEPLLVSRLRYILY